MKMPMRLHGLVLAVEPDRGQAVIRHDAIGDMPGMTMTFRIVPASEAAHVRAGETIDALVDMTTDPWSISELHVAGGERLTGAASEEKQAGNAALPRSEIRNVTPLDVGSRLPDTSFVDQNGKPFIFSHLRGSDVVVAFIYTRCRDPRMCPLVSAKFRRLQDLLAGTKTKLVEISLDPQFDTPAQLRAYANALGANTRRWTLLTGDPDRTLDFAAQFNVTALADPHYGIIHSERTVVVDTDGYIRQLIDANSWQPEEIVNIIQANERGASNPLLRLNLWLSSQAAALCGDNLSGFSGLGDAIVVLLVFGSLGWLCRRLYLRMFSES